MLKNQAPGKSDEYLSEKELPKITESSVLRYTVCNNCIYIICASSYAARLAPIMPQG